MQKEITPLLLSLCAFSPPHPFLMVQRSSEYYAFYRIVGSAQTCVLHVVCVIIF